MSDKFMGDELTARFEKEQSKVLKQHQADIYLSSLIQDDYENFKEIFSETEDDVLPDDKLFDKVKETIMFMQSDALRISGVVVTYLKIDDERQQNEPTVNLGWRKYNLILPELCDEDEGKVYPHILRLTDTGLDVVNKWREAQGYVSLEEQKQINRDRADA